MPRLLTNGDMFLKPNESPKEIPGYTLKDKSYTQNFLPCKHRKITKCKTCPSKKARTIPTCKLKNIKKLLVCTDCPEREE